ncbi:MAG: hypothetical protein E6J41_17765 [Chloroflexi bacterium]|nr:MAG: hypothetical protein E6J41_17765 [Chloroflexota bacterium]
MSTSLLDPAQADVSALRQLDQYPFDQVRAQLLADGMEPATVERSIEELRKYFKLIAHGYRDLGMTSPEVDAAWHALILHTRDYAEFCQSVFGRFIHHRPLRGAEVADVAPAANLHRAYSAVFGTPDPRVWQEVTKCNGGGKCQSCQDE